MITVKTNIIEFLEKTQRLADTLERFELLIPEQLAKKFWDQNRSLIGEYLKQMIDFFANIPGQSDEWRTAKSHLIGVSDVETIKEIMYSFGFNPEWLERYGKTQPIVSAENWKATGTMENVLFDGIENRGGDSFDMLGAMAIMGVNVDVSALRDEKFGYYYPNFVDEQLMSISGGSVGVLRIFVWQQKKLFEKLEALTDQLFLLAAAKAQG